MKFEEVLNVVKLYFLCSVGITNKCTRIIPISFVLTTLLLSLRNYLSAGVRMNSKGFSHYFVIFAPSYSLQTLVQGQFSIHIETS